MPSPRICNNVIQVKFGPSARFALLPFSVLELVLLDLPLHVADNNFKIFASCIFDSFGDLQSAVTMLRS